MLASGGSPSMWTFIPFIILFGIAFAAGIYSIFKTLGGALSWFKPAPKSRKPKPEPKRPLTKEEQEEIRTQKQEEWAEYVSRNNKKHPLSRERQEEIRIQKEEEWIRNTVEARRAAQERQRQEVKKNREKAFKARKTREENSKSIKPFLEYDVLKRDKSKCQICGQGPPKTNVYVDYKDHSQKKNFSINDLHVVCAEHGSALSPKPKKKNRKENRGVSRELRQSVLKRDEHKCVACGRGRKEGVPLHVDHIVPFSKGGKTELKNLQTLCARHNLGKSNRDDTDWRDL